MKIVTRAQRRQAASLRLPNILCLSIDRINPDLFGAYGATWNSTPAFDALSTESILFDNFHATSLDLDALLRAFWRGEEPYAVNLDNEPSDDVPSIFQIMKERGYRAFLLSDVENVALSPCVDSDHVERFLLETEEERDEPAESIEETALFKNFEQLTRFLSSLDDSARIDAPQPWFAWAHLSGWNERWDFPSEMREAFQDEGDPEPYAAVRPPYWRREPLSRRVHGRAFRSVEITEDVAVGEDASLAARERARLNALDESERRQSVLEACAAGVGVFDETLDGFVELLKEHNLLKNTLFVLTGTRSLALGAPSALGAPGPEDVSSPFYSEETRLPLILRLPHKTCATLRLPTLCGPTDLFATLRDFPDFAPRLVDPDFWKLEPCEISAVVGKWTLDPEDESAAKEESAERDATIEETRRGHNLLELVVDETRPIHDSIVVVARDKSSLERAAIFDKWYLKRTPLKKNPEDEFAPTERVELFVQPDDRYCVNDVADRLQDDAERLTPSLDPQE